MFSQSFFLSAGETNAEGEMSLPLLTSKIIDIATLHANSLGIGNPAMSHLGCGWVLSRLALEMMRYPRVNENYKLSTWVTAWNRHFSERLFMVSDAEDIPCGYARSIWMVLDTASRESVGLSHLTLPEEALEKHDCPAARQGRHVQVIPPGDGESLPPGSVAATSAPERYRFRYCDLDNYRHVNTVRYVSLLLNQFSLDDFDRTMVKRLELAFMKELRYGEEVDILRHDDGLATTFSLRHASDHEQTFSGSIIRTCRQDTSR